MRFDKRIASVAIVSSLCAACFAAGAFAVSARLRRAELPPLCAVGDGEDLVFSYPATSNPHDRSGARRLAETTEGGQALRLGDPGSASPCGSNFSLSFRVRTTGAGQVLDASDGAAGTFSRGLGVTVARGGEECNGGWSAPAGSIYFNYGNGKSVDGGFCSSAAVADGAWHDVRIAVRPGVSVEFYVDGSQSGSMASLEGPVIFPRLTWGAGQWAEALAGELEDLKLSLTVGPTPPLAPSGG